MHLKTTLMKQMVSVLSAPDYRECKGFLLSVSGGLDSMVLLDVFRRMAHVHGARLRVCHIHHGTGRFADVSQHLVTRYCEDHDIPLVLRSFRGENGNFEYEAARFRREVLEEERRDTEKIVLAHHLRDQVETFFLAVTRGAGVASPVGMASGDDHRLRPLLHISRSELEEHARRAGVPHVLDPSNYGCDNFRNAIRHEVLPVLDRFHEGSEVRIGRWVSQWNALRSALASEASALFVAGWHEGVLARSVFDKASPYLWDFLLARFWEEQGIAKPCDHTHQQLKQHLADGTCGFFTIRNGRLYCDLDGLIVVPAPQTEAVRAAFNEPFQWGPWRMILRPGPRFASCAFANECFFRLFPASCHPKSARDRLRRLRVPHRVRDNLPDISIGEKTFHLIELSVQDREIMELMVIHGPNPGVFSQHPTGLKLASDV